MRSSIASLLLIVLLLPLGCGRRMEPAVPVAVQGCDDPMGRAWYLLPVHAENAVAGTPAFTDFTRSSALEYVDQLRALEGPAEPSFRCGSVPAQAYRFAWVPAFFPGVVIRAQRDAAGRAWIVGRSAREMPDPEPPPHPGEPERRSTIIQDWTCAPPRALSTDEWNTVVAAFAPMQGEDEHAGLDGAAWIFESVVEGEQRWFARWVPRMPMYRDAGRQMVALAGCTDALQALG